MSKLAIGIDIGGTNSKYGIADRSGKIIAQSRVKTQEFKDAKIFLRTIKKEIEKIHSLEGVIGIGVGAPNANFYKGTIENPPNLPWKGTSLFAKEMEEVFGLKTVVTNDANAAALGESMYGKARNMKDFIVLTVGTGLGGGVFANNDLVYGKHGFAGELGHTLVNANGRNCACGKKGCLETYVSATGIRRTVYKLLADYTEPSILRSISYDDLSTRTITDAAAKGDKIAIEAFKYTGRILGMKLSDFIVHTNPEAIFLLGGLSKAGDHLFIPAQKNMEKYLMPLFLDKKIQLLPSGLKDDDAPILGASSLVWKYLDKEEK
ncbi:MAG: ROK family protein [Ekhidna sp.]|nr:ROK family protein [Ekhidna sp.]MBC6426992.1 ROK family protein [Ekhidna sp.]